MDIQVVATWLLTQPAYLRAVITWVAGKRPFLHCAAGRHDWAFPLSVERRCRRCRLIEEKLAGQWQKRAGYTSPETHR